MSAGMSWDNRKGKWISRNKRFVILEKPSIYVIDLDTYNDASFDTIEAAMDWAQKRLDAKS